MRFKNRLMRRTADYCLVMYSFVNYVIKRDTRQDVITTRQRYVSVNYVFFSGIENP